jgi:uncharacterized membrane protein YfhO
MKIFKVHFKSKISFIQLIILSIFLLFLVYLREWKVTWNKIAAGVVVILASFLIDNLEDDRMVMGVFTRNEFFVDLDNPSAGQYKYPGATLEKKQ